MLILGLDFETTGLDKENDRIIEVGAVLWDTVEKAPRVCYSRFVKHQGIGDLKPDIKLLTGIDDLLLHDFGVEPHVFIEELGQMEIGTEAVFAHNAEFDKAFLLAELKRQGWSTEGWAAKRWIDTMVDIPYPQRMQTRKLSYIAAEHGFVNPFAHRALFDVLTMLQVVSRYDIQEILAFAAEPKVELLAQTQAPWHDGGASTNLAKARGYHWDGARKVWAKTVKLSQVPWETEHGEFPVRRVE